MNRYWYRLGLVLVMVFGLLQASSGVLAVERMFGGGVNVYAPELMLAWATEASAIEPNQVVSFELTLSNSGPDEALDVQLTVLPVADGWFGAGPDVPAGGSPLLQTVIALVPAGQTQTIAFQFQLTGLPANDLLLTAQAATAGQAVVESSYTLPIVRPPVEQLQIGAGHPKHRHQPFGGK